MPAASVPDDFWYNGCVKRELKESILYERIAQMVIARHEQGDFVVVEELDETERGEGGYGHTGVK